MDNDSYLAADRYVAGVVLITDGQITSGSESSKIVSEKGFPVSVHLDFNSRNTRRKCIARCSKGDLTWDVANNKVIWLPGNKTEQVKMYQNDRDYIYREQLFLHHRTWKY